jgi:hypothetical protein
MANSTRSTSYAIPFWDTLGQAWCPSNQTACLISILVTPIVGAIILMSPFLNARPLSPSFQAFRRVSCTFPWRFFLANVACKAALSFGFGMLSAFTSTDPGYPATAAVSGISWLVCFLLSAQQWRKQLPLSDVFFVWVVVAAVAQTCVISTLEVQPMLAGIFIKAIELSSLAGLSAVSVWVVFHSGPLEPPYSQSLDPSSNRQRSCMCCTTRSAASTTHDSQESEAESRDLLRGHEGRAQGRQNHDSPEGLEMASLKPIASESPGAVLNLSARVPFAAPSDLANLFSRLTFSWVSRLLATGRLRPLQLDDLPVLGAQDTSTAVAAALTAAAVPQERLCTRRAWLCCVRHREYSRADAPVSITPVPFSWILIKSFGKDLGAAVTLKLCYDSLLLLAPMLLHVMITYLEAVAQSLNPPVWLGYGLCGMLLCCAVMQTALLHQYFFQVFRCGQQLRCAIILSIYKKALRLSGASRSSEGAGKLANLMSVDAKRIQDLTTYLIVLVSGPFQISVALVLLYQQIGVAVLSGLAAILLFLPVNAAVAHFTQKLQDSLMKVIVYTRTACYLIFLCVSTIKCVHVCDQVKDKRLSLTTEALTAVRLLKLNAWEDEFQGRIDAVRLEELAKLRRFVLLQMASDVLWSALPLLVTLASLITYSLLNEGKPPPAANMFVSLSLFSTLRFPLSMVPSVITSVSRSAYYLSLVSRFLRPMFQIRR